MGKHRRGLATEPAWWRWINEISERGYDATTMAVALGIATTPGPGGADDDLRRRVRTAELAIRYGLSRGEVRAAVDELTGAGFLEPETGDPAARTVGYRLAYPTPLGAA